ncbi:hypothetical protein [Providencia manganoxydans]|uniref:hypothetical protein n=1 Tax=Providencia manganoxydans TaxID=2923283 RepID=UPI00280E805E|nr:hypothetical protein [Providencia stuartii]ELR5083500.1 hypothetical protein [Providencia stuartii]
MNIAINNRNMLLTVCVFLLVTFLSGCSKHFIEHRNKNNFIELEGYIYAKNIDIPNDAVITLSITPMLIPENSNAPSSDYQFITKDIGRSAEFRISVPKYLYEKTELFGISARVEKNNELIMMSDKITPISKNSMEKIVLTVISN